MGKADLRVDWATHEAAKYACENWHYSGCLPSGKLVKIGVWEHRKFIGVVLFGRGASPFLGKKFQLSPDQCVELVRISLKQHSCPVSRIVKLALKMLKKTNPNLRLVVSFADPDKGHHGGVYQAGNWIFSGDSGKTTELFLRGRWVHMRGGWYQKNENTPQRTMPGKHRYLMPLDLDMRKQIEPLSKPYPKRVKQAMASFPEAQRQGGTDPHAPKLKSSHG